MLMFYVVNMDLGVTCGFYGIDLSIIRKLGKMVLETSLHGVIYNVHVILSYCKGWVLSGER